MAEAKLDIEAVEKLWAWVNNVVYPSLPAALRRECEELRPDLNIEKIKRDLIKTIDGQPMEEAVRELVTYTRYNILDMHMGLIGLWEKGLLPKGLGKRFCYDVGMVLSEAIAYGVGPTELVLNDPTRLAHNLEWGRKNHNQMMEQLGYDSHARTPTSGQIKIFREWWALETRGLGRTR